MTRMDFSRTEGLGYVGGVRGGNTLAILVGGIGF